MTSKWPESVDGEAALRHVEAQVAIGERPSGSEGIVRCREYIRRALEGFGLPVEEQRVRRPTPLGEIEFVNVLATIPGDSDRFILLGSHYDTKRLPGIRFVGANDGGSSTGLLLELARVLQAAGTPRLTLRFAFFDGEECIVRYGPDDGLVGSRALAGAWERSGELDRMEAMILLDMVGDRDLTLTLPTDGDPRLIRLAYETAERLGFRDRLTSLGSEVLDDHVPFADRGIPAIDLIDFEFGTRPLANDLWHTEGDRLDAVSAASLETVGRLTLGMLRSLMETGVEGVGR